MAIRASRVSSRNRLIRPASASALPAGSLAASGGSIFPTTRISSRSVVMVGGSVNQPSGSRPVNQASSPSAAGTSSSARLPLPPCPPPRGPNRPVLSWGGLMARPPPPRPRCRPRGGPNGPFLSGGCLMALPLSLCCCNYTLTQKKNAVQHVPVPAAICGQQDHLGTAKVVVVN